MDSTSCVFNKVRTLSIVIPVSTMSSNMITERFFKSVFNPINSSTRPEVVVPWYELTFTKETSTLDEMHFIKSAVNMKEPFKMDKKITFFPW